MESYIAQELNRVISEFTEETEVGINSINVSLLGITSVSDLTPRFIVSHVE